MLVVFDLDGTIADVRHRLHFIRPTPPVDPITGKKVKRDFGAFHRACVDDTPVTAVCNIYKRLVADPNVIVIVLSGRDVATLPETQAWFTRHDLPLPDEMLLKVGDQNLPDTEQKRFTANRLEKKYKQPIAMVFDDRARVVQMWKERGTFVFNVDQ